mmetsp:Transcript_6470/g.23412  ORF Transcript_6470/g.23412 Transcript_6470/m.23412 type:complete len:212 (+) Transcript_6470:2413-3048(+)
MPLLDSSCVQQMHTTSARPINAWYACVSLVVHTSRRLTPHLSLSPSAAHGERFVADNAHPNACNRTAIARPIAPHPTINTELSNNAPPVGEPRRLSAMLCCIWLCLRRAASAKYTPISAVLTAFPVFSLGMRATRTRARSDAASISTPSRPTPYCSTSLSRPCAPRSRSSGPKRVINGTAISADAMCASTSCRSHLETSTSWQLASTHSRV